MGVCVCTFGRRTRLIAGPVASVLLNVRLASSAPTSGLVLRVVPSKSVVTVSKYLPADSNLVAEPEATCNESEELHGGSSAKECSSVPTHPFDAVLKNALHSASVYAIDPAEPIPP